MLVGGGVHGRIGMTRVLDIFWTKLKSHPAAIDIDSKSKAITGYSRGQREEKQEITR